MVLKKSKFGLSTGNTQRNWKKDEFYYDNYLILSKHITRNHAKSRLGKDTLNSYDGNLETSVFYSLRKKKRWQLLHTLYETQVEGLIDMEINLIPPKNNNNTSSIKLKFQEEDILEENSDKNIPNREIKYNIYHPTRRRRDYKPDNDPYFYASNRDIRKFGLTFYEDFDTMSEYEANEEDTEEATTNQNIFSQNKFLDYFQKASPSKNYHKSRLKCFKKKRLSSFEKSTHIIYAPLAVDVPSKISANSSYENIKEFSMISQTILVWSESLKSENLRKTFGNDYYETECIPQRFTIQISHFLKNALSLKSSQLEFKNLGLDVFVVFDLNQIKISNDDIQSVRIYLHGNFNNISLAVDILDSSQVYSVERIVQIMVDYLLCTMYTSLPIGDPLNFTVPPTYDYVQQHLLHLLNLELSIFSLEEIFLEAQSYSKEQKKCLLSTTQEKFTDLFCNICYMQINQPDNLLDGMALVFCNHWFCNSCWHDYVISQLMLTKSQIICPDFNCDVPVSVGALRTIIAGEDFNHYAIRNCQAILNKHGKLKWCPNSECNHLAFLSKNDLQINPIPVNCACFQQWCFECQNMAHWPATCKQFSLYKSSNKVSAWKYNEGAIVDIPVKRCPLCDYPIEKFHGCSFMLCKCGSSFCWECLEPLDKHNVECSQKISKPFEHIELNDIKSRYYKYKETSEYHQKAAQDLSFRRLKILKHVKICFSYASTSSDEIVAESLHTINVMQKLKKQIGEGILMTVKTHKLAEFTLVWLHYSKLAKIEEGFIRNILGQLLFLLLRFDQMVENKSYTKLMHYVDKIKWTSHHLLKQIVRIKQNKKRNNLK